jgi:hypothetical protein
MQLMGDVLDQLMNLRQIEVYGDNDAANNDQQLSSP